MSFWENAVASADGMTEDDFEQAASRLITEQVLYAADYRSKVAYALIRDFEREFRRALEPLGYRLHINGQLRYACAIPRHSRNAVASVKQTLLALVLRQIFDEETQRSSRRAWRSHLRSDYSGNQIPTDYRARVGQRRQTDGAVEVDAALGISTTDRRNQGIRRTGNTATVCGHHPSGNYRSIGRSGVDAARSFQRSGRGRR